MSATENQLPSKNRCLVGEGWGGGGAVKTWSCTGKVFLPFSLMGRPSFRAPEAGRHRIARRRKPRDLGDESFSGAPNVGRHCRAGRRSRVNSRLVSGAAPPGLGQCFMKRKPGADAARLYDFTAPRLREAPPPARLGQSAGATKTASTVRSDRAVQAQLFTGPGRDWRRRKVGLAPLNGSSQFR